MDNAPDPMWGLRRDQRKFDSFEVQTWHDQANPKRPNLPSWRRKGPASLRALRKTGASARQRCTITRTIAWLALTAGGRPAPTCRKKDWPTTARPCPRAITRPAVPVREAGGLAQGHSRQGPLRLSRRKIHLSIFAYLGHLHDFTPTVHAQVRSSLWSAEPAILSSRTMHGKTNGIQHGKQNSKTQY